MPRILIIDDDRLVLETLSAGLDAAGHDVATANTADSGLRQIETFFPDVVLLDIHMPDTDGIETLSNIRKHKPGQPVIAMSGGGRFNADMMLDFARALGADAVMQKPFPIKDLTAKIAKILS